MRLKNIMAVPHPAGNRIDLRWKNPDPIQYPGVRIVRRERTHPVSPEDGVLVAAGEGMTSAVDKNLKGETVYYYTLFPYKGGPPEYQIDLHNRVSAMTTAPYDLAGQMYELLPAIYHRYDTLLPKIIPPVMPEEDRHRGQLHRFLDLPGRQLDLLRSFARAMLDLYDIDRVDGKLLPLLAEWIGWKTDYRLEIEAQRNELRNAPAIYQTIGLNSTVEATVKRITGWESRTKEFVHNVFLSNRPERLNLWLRERSAGVWSEPTGPLSLNFAYEGRPAAAREADGTLSLFYHTLKKGRWNIWYKTYRQEEGWASSRPLTDRAGIDKYPTAAVQGTTLWVFWSAYLEIDQRWHLHYQTRSGGVWSPIRVDEPFAQSPNDRRRSWAAVDPNGGLWLFWLEREGGGWALKYNRHDGTGWQLSPAATFPLDAGADPRVEADLFLLIHPTDPNQRIWAFWARKEATGEPGQTRWQIAYRVKQGIDPNTFDWGEIRTLPKPAPEIHDREPAGVVLADGKIELFWSADRSGGWSIWRSLLDTGTHTLGTAEEVATGSFSRRDPLPLSIEDRTWLIYRSNESRIYTSRVYSATTTVDARDAGATTVHTRNVGKIALRGAFEDFQSYTYDTGRTREDWYARDTLGLYLTPDTFDPEKTKQGRDRLEKVLKEFMPITDRAVLITQPDLQTEEVYTYDRPAAATSFISESYQDALTSVLEETALGPEEDFSDELT